ncbi:MAG TPA: heparan-alpha-glucosaminide N-acetyltransferase domain-containing protein [Polyangia bacterium]|nr:heparan-alpha-glucosaminide N-acetyltransferase domain-containing protein [Polyangia bacterium]
MWPARAPAKERLLSLDVHRGLCVIAMMLVDWTGTWDGRYAVFEHANWLGVTLPDFIFPSFLFIAGVAIAVSIDRDAPPGRLWRRVLRRSLLLFACGLALNVFWDWEPGVPLLPKLRIMGVLQRYALVYPAAVALHRALSRRQLMMIVAGILVGYWLLVAFVPVPGFGAPDLTINPHGQALTPTWATWLDERVLGRHMAIFYPHDPEGLLTTLPSLATALIGVLAGSFWRHGPGSDEQRLNRLFAWGVGLLIAGELWSVAFPLGKKLWTSSFVLVTGGVALLLLAALLLRLDLQKRRRFIALPRWYGANALVAIMAFTFLDNLLRVTGAKDGVFVLLCRLLPARDAAWVYSVLGILLLGLVFRELHRRRTFLRL